MRLGKTVRELLATADSQELTDWATFLTIEAEDAKEPQDGQTTYWGRRDDEDDEEDEDDA